MITHQLEHNKTTTKSKYENNRYRLWEYYLEYFKRQLVTKDCLWSFVAVAG